MRNILFYPNLRSKLQEQIASCNIALTCLVHFLFLVSSTLLSPRDDFLRCNDPFECFREGKRDCPFIESSSTSNSGVGELQKQLQR